MTGTKKTRIVGITGGIACGKSTIGRMLADRWLRVIDSDQVAHELTVADSPCLKKIVDAFGDEVLTPYGALNREKMAAIVFSDKRKLAILEKILHPVIHAECHRRAEESGEEWVFMLLPLLFEAGMEDSVDRIWLCYAPMEVRLKRAMDRDGASREETLARMSSQIPDEEKISRSDAVINTDAPLKEVEAQIDRLLGELGSES